MRPALLLAGFFLLCLTSAPSLAQNAWRWFDPADQTWKITDTPPPGRAQKVEKSAARVVPNDLPYATQMAARNFPITLYTQPVCDGCEQGRALLQKRGLPFTEKEVKSQAELEEVKKLSGKTSLPFLTVGPQKFSGYEEKRWNDLLDIAGYPK
ncbi:MAG: glutaredoxin family protein [Zoogloeaceae bacterium]|nr:glutaredoxin family protein [Zoogloeaceae bacterium]